jgi:hypothetical protein
VALQVGSVEQPQVQLLVAWCLVLAPLPVQ